MLTFAWDERKAATNLKKQDESDSIIRIINARKATRQEARSYGSFKKMRKEYDFSESKSNPYARKLKRQVTIRIDEDALEYFKTLATEMGMPYQSLINNYLRECARTHKRPSVKWA